MRTRMLIPVGLLVLGGLVAPACGGDDSSDTAAKTSDERTDSGNSDSGDSGSGSSDSGGSDSGSSSDSTLPDVGDITESIPGLENMGDCLDLAASYSSLYLEALGGADGAKDAQAKAKEMKSQLPDDLHDDIDVVADAIGEVADKGIVNGSDALSTSEYEDANTAITDYLTKECGG